MKFRKRLSPKRALMYAVSVGILFALLYFAMIAPTWLVAFPYVMTPFGYTALCALLAVVPFYWAREKSTETGKWGRFLLDFLAVLVGGALCFGAAALLTQYREEAGQRAQGARADAFLETADELISYNLNDQHSPDRRSPKDPRFLLPVSSDPEDSGTQAGQYLTDTILIDYETATVAFYYSVHNGVFRFEQFPLSEGALPEPDSHMQAKIPLSRPGAVLTTYYSGEDMEHRTAALQLSLPDGQVYSISGLQEENGYPLYLGLSRTDADNGEPNYLVRPVRDDTGRLEPRQEDVSGRQTETNKG